MRKTLTILALFASLTVYCQDKTDIIIMKIQQNYDLLRVDSYIRISYPDQKIKTIELTKAGYKIDDTEEDSNAKIIQKTINELTSDGYRVVSSDISGDYHFTRTIVTLERKKN